MEVPSFASFEFNRNRPLQAQLQQYLVDWIISGRLAPGSRLPASRLLAKELGISRNTITAVFDQLRSEGFLDSYQGKGVYISANLPSHTNSPSSVTWRSEDELPSLSEFARFLDKSPLSEHDNNLPFTPGLPDLSAFPHKTWLQIQRRHQDRACLMGYSGAQGYPDLREALTNYLRLSRGVRCSPEQIIITQGAQQGISLCAQLLLNKGDEVLVENPGYIGARKAFAAHHASLVPCPLGSNGLDLNELEKQQTSQSSRAKLMYVTPTHQYPMGGILPAPDRLKLLDWATHNGTWLIEDDYDSEFHYFHKPITALQGMADQTPVIYMGSFSKTLFPALRLGYLVVPEKLVKVFIKAKSYMSGESPLLTQAIAADFIIEGHFVRHLRRMRLLYQEKWQHLSHLLEQTPQLKPIAQSAGMHLAVEIPRINDQQLSRQYKSAGFGSSALSSYFLEEPARTGLVLGFANTTTEDRERGVKVLSSLINQAYPDVSS